MPDGMIRFIDALVSSLVLGCIGISVEQCLQEVKLWPALDHKQYPK